MNNIGQPIFPTISDGESIDRKNDIDNIYKLAIETSNDTTHSIYLYGKRKVGKTEVLKRVYNRLFWEQDKIIPFYYCFYKDFSDIHEFAKDYLLEFAKQYLGFIKKQPSIIRKNTSLYKILRYLKDEDYPGLKELIGNYQDHKGNNDYIGALRNSIAAPYAISVEGNERVFVILDDFHRTKYIKSGELKCNILEEFSKVLNDRLSPHLITGFSKKMLKEILCDEIIIGKTDIMTLRDYEKNEVYKLFENICTLYKVKFLKENVYLMANQLSLNPFYLKCYIRSAKRFGIDICTLKNFQKLYMQEISSGNIGFYLCSILNTFLKEEDKPLAVKILKVCAEAPKEGVSAGFIADVIHSDPEETSKVLLSLQEGDLVENDYGRAKGITDPVLRDFIFFTYFTMVEGQSSSSVIISMMRDGLKTLSHKSDYKFLETVKVQVEKTLNSFDCQRAPKILFEFKNYHSRYGKSDFAKVSENIKKEEELSPLPQIIGVSEFCFKRGDSRDKHIFLLGYGFEDENYIEGQEVLWQCGIFSSSALIGVDEVEKFLKIMGEMKKEREHFKIVHWIVTDGGFTDAAIERMNKNKIKSSNLNQLHHLNDWIIKEGKNTHEPMEDINSDNQGNEFELIIPMASNTELVAVKAIEEIARRADFDQDSIDQIKMALVEACINASEHSKLRGGKIIIKFIVDLNKLVVYVCNEGKGFDPSLIAKPQRDGKTTGSLYRGWGIKLMKNFMDEVTFEKTNGGTKLKMVKLMKK